jgi:Tol biopolymer transport system component
VPDSPELHGWARLVVVRPGEQPVEPNCDCSYGPEEASWSPDGQRLTFVSGGVYDPDPVGALQITDLSTGQNRYLTRRLDGAPAWSPDGALIAFVRHPSAESVDDIPERARARRLYLIPATGGTPRRVLNIEASHPSWSPDGKHIAFDDGTRIGIVGRNGGTTRFITAGTYPAWSLDGTTIAYMRLNSVWLVQADGRRPHLVAKNASDPAWRPTP